MRELGTATKKEALNGVEILRGLLLIAGFWAVLTGAAAGGELDAEDAPGQAPAAKASEETGWTAPKIELSGKTLFDGGDVKVWSYDSRVAAGWSWQPAERVTVSALAGASYKLIDMGEEHGRSTVSHLGLFEVGGVVRVRGSERLDLVLQANAGAVLLGCRETTAHEGVEESQAVSGAVASVQAGVEWRLPGERFSLTAGVVYEQVSVSYESGADDHYGKMGFALGLAFRF